MTKRILRLALVVGAAASFAAPAQAAVPAVCQTHQALADCVKDLLSADIREICVPTGDLEDDCHWG